MRTVDIKSKNLKKIDFSIKIQENGLYLIITLDIVLFILYNSDMSRKKIGKSM